MSDDATPVADAEHCWEEGWEGHERAQRLRFASWPLEQKLRALEDMEALARQLLGAEGYRRARQRSLDLPPC